MMYVIEVPALVSLQDVPMGKLPKEMLAVNGPAVEVCGLALLVERHVERLQHLYRQIVLLPDIFVFVVLQFQHQVLALLSTVFRQAL
jgi:hypothetical protein